MEDLKREYEACDDDDEDGREVDNDLTEIREEMNDDVTVMEDSNGKNMLISDSKLVPSLDNQYNVNGTLTSSS
jgi:hypothetical protein